MTDVDVITDLALFDQLTQLTDKIVVDFTSRQTDSFEENASAYLTCVDANWRIQQSALLLHPVLWVGMTVLHQEARVAFAVDDDLAMFQHPQSADVLNDMGLQAWVWDTLNDKAQVWSSNSLLSGHALARSVTHPAWTQLPATWVRAGANLVMAGARWGAELGGSIAMMIPGILDDDHLLLSRWVRLLHEHPSGVGSDVLPSWSNQIVKLMDNHRCTVESVWNAWEPLFGPDSADAVEIGHALQLHSTMMVYKDAERCAKRMCQFLLQSRMGAVDMDVSGMKNDIATVRLNQTSNQTMDNYGVLLDGLAARVQKEMITRHMPAGQKTPSRSM